MLHRLRSISADFTVILRFISGIIPVPKPDKQEWKSLDLLPPPQALFLYVIFSLAVSYNKWSAPCGKSFSSPASISVYSPATLLLLIVLWGGHKSNTRTPPKHLFLTGWNYAFNLLCGLSFCLWLCLPMHVWWLMCSVCYTYLFTYGVYFSFTFGKYPDVNCTCCLLQLSHSINGAELDLMEDELI